MFKWLFKKKVGPVVEATEALYDWGKLKEYLNKMNMIKYDLHFQPEMYYNNFYEAYKHFHGEELDASYLLAGKRCYFSLYDCDEALWRDCLNNNNTYFEKFDINFPIAEIVRATQDIENWSCLNVVTDDGAIVTEVRYKDYPSISKQFTFTVSRFEKALLHKVINHVRYEIVTCQENKEREQFNKGWKGV